MSLLKEVRTALASRPQDWKRMAEDTGISISWIEQNGSGRYASNPTYDRVEKVAAWLRRNPGKRVSKHGRNVRSRT